MVHSLSAFPCYGKLRIITYFLMNKNNNRLIKRRPNRSKRSMGMRRSVPMLLDAKSWSLESGSMPRGNDASRYDNSVYTCYQTVRQGALLTTSTLTSTTAGTYFTIGQVDQVGALQAVFDQYRIDLIEVWIVPKGSSDNKQYSQESAFLYSVIDYDDSTAPATLAAMTDFSNCLVTTMMCGHYRRWKPHVAVAQYAGTFTGFGNVVSPWIDLNSVGVVHYGIKIGADITAVAVTIDYRIRFTLSFRNIR